MAFQPDVESYGRNQGLRRPEAASEGQMQAGLAEIRLMMQEPKYGFAVTVDNENDPNFWYGVARGLGEIGGDVGSLRNKVEMAADALRQGQKVDIRQLVSDINTHFQQ